MHVGTRGGAVCGLRAVLVLRGTEKKINYDERTFLGSFLNVGLCGGDLKLFVIPLFSDKAIDLTKFGDRITLFPSFKQS